MRLKEYKDAHGNKVNTSSSTGSSSASSGSFKKRLDKLIKYYGQHLPKTVASVNVTLLTNDTLAFTEYYDDGTVTEFNIYIGPTTEAWRLKIIVDSKLTDDLAGQGWVELLKTLRAFITVPVVSTPEYKDLLVEWVDKTGKKVGSSSTSQPATKSFGGYKKRFEKLIDYQVAHLPPYVMNYKKDITDYTLQYTEERKGGYSSYPFELSVGINKDGEWNFSVYIDKAQRARKSGKGWDTLVWQLSFYLALPNDASDPEYQDLLTESCSVAEELERIPKKLYHATYKQFLKSIKSKGLGNTKRKMWSDSQRGVVYLADDPWVAESYAETAEWPEERDDPDAYYDNIIILEIDATKLDPSKIKVDSNVLLDAGEENATWEYHGIIPWDAIEIFNSSSIAEEFKAYENLWD